MNINTFAKNFLIKTKKASKKQREKDQRKIKIIQTQKDSQWSSTIKTKVQNLKKKRKRTNEY